MMKFCREGTGVPEKAVPIPASWEFSTECRQLQVSFAASDLPRFRVIYGFLGSTSDCPDMEDTCAPLQLQVVAKFPYKFGKTSAETQHSHIYARVNTFSSRALLDKPFEALTLGTPIRGILDVTDSRYGSAQLLG